jgi:tetratricopeptide (TPR) repeat protein
MVLACAALACAAAPAAPPAPAASPAPSALADALIALGGEALAAGNAELAQDRFQRALAADRDSAPARAGLGRALLAEGRLEAARAALEDAVSRDPADADARLGLADLAAATGHRDEAQRQLERLLAVAPGRLEALQRLADLTGPAAPGPAPDLAAALARAHAHPFDPRALTDAGSWLVRSGRADAARGPLERSLQVADLDPASATRALALLRAHVPEWRTRRVVPVHVYVDEVLQADPTWRFQVRLAWAALSQSLEPALDVRFLPLSLGAFRSEGTGFDLGPMRAAFLAQHPRLPDHGIVAAFTGRPVPRAPGTWQRGEAKFLGRLLIVRLAPGEVQSRVLAHEVLHLYGAIHVNPDVPSLMNPTADSGDLDRWNLAIVRALRDRRFGPGGVEANVLGHVDLDATIAAYRAALGVNVALRNAGVLQALDASDGSPLAAAPGLRAATELDEQLGDVASFVAELLLRDGRRAASAAMFETAARLYGPATVRGRRARERARALGAAG